MLHRKNKPGKIQALAIASLILLSGTGYAHSESEFPVTQFPSSSEKAFWKKTIKKMWMRPGCCGACALLSRSDYLIVGKVLQSNAKNTPENRIIWKKYGRKLVLALKRQDPFLYKKYLTFFGNSKKERRKRDERQN